ncbi:SIR2 family protein [Pontibacter oryzae]|uniref:Uncharacterized protein n=1 Tax=Pontibacter oryzae TaxID=2304593 RepID=A0A399SL17_9BACT|nr:SIR2 family protein [Pontibacter oryzae]RIJ42657.1 hypothetical protein D1627_02035 [Pontibacter oryzae]
MENKTVKDNEHAIKKIEDILQSGYVSNGKFNDVFDSDQLVSINSLIGDRDPYEFKPSEILFWVERGTYYDELDNFQNGEAQEKFNELIEYLYTSEQESVFEELKDAIERKRVAPFIGAGISKSFDFPLWEEALRNINDSLGKLNGVEDLISSYDYLQAAECLFQYNPTIFNHYIRKKFPLGLEKKNDLVKWGVPRLLTKVTSGCVITTNYDKILEVVFESDGKPFQGFMRGVNQEKFVTKLIKNDRCILKLHGDYEYEDSYIFCQSQYSNAYYKDGTSEIDFTKPLPKTLRQIYISYSLLFLGCSLEQDKTLDLFNNVKSENQFDIPDHFAILENKNPEEPQWKIDVESRLLSLNIRPIWFPKGKYEMIEQMISLALDLIEKKVNFKRKKS